MKTLFITVALSVLFFGTNLFAVFNGPSSRVDTVAKVKSIEDVTLIILQGRIVEKIGPNDYIFRDATGKIKIDNANWKKLNVNPETILKIYGEHGNGHLGNVDLVISRVEIMNNNKYEK